MGAINDYRQESRKNWGSSKDGMNIEEIKCGALLRIADSLENMEQPYKRLLEDSEYLRKRHRENLDRIEYLEKSRAAYKGIITKLKNKDHE